MPQDQSWGGTGTSTPATPATLSDDSSAVTPSDAVVASVVIAAPVEQCHSMNRVAKASNDDSQRRVAESVAEPATTSLLSSLRRAYPFRQSLELVIGRQSRKHSSIVAVGLP